MCYTRVLRDGSLLKGGPGNVPFDAVFAEGIKGQRGSVAENRRLMEELFWKPWSPSELSSTLKSLDA